MLGVRRLSVRAKWFRGQSDGHVGIQEEEHGRIRERWLSNQIVCSHFSRWVVSELYKVDCSMYYAPFVATRAYSLKE